MAVPNKMPNIFFMSVVFLSVLKVKCFFMMDKDKQKKYIFDSLPPFIEKNMSCFVMWDKIDLSLRHQFNKKENEREIYRTVARHRKAGHRRGD